MCSLSRVKTSVQFRCGILRYATLGGSTSKRVRVEFILRKFAHACYVISDALSEDLPMAVARQSKIVVELV